MGEREGDGERRTECSNNFTFRSSHHNFVSFKCKHHSLIYLCFFLYFYVLCSLLPAATCLIQPISVSVSLFFISVYLAQSLAVTRMNSITEVVDA